jgi:cell division protein FtsW
MDNKIRELIQKHVVGDYQIWLIVILLNLFGLMIQFSAKSRMVMTSPMEPLSGFIKTLVILAISFVLMSYFAKMNYSKIAQISNFTLVISWVLILIALVFGENKGGASRWIALGPISFMPSDMAKLCLTASLAKEFSVRQADPESYTWKVMLSILLKLGTTCFLIMLSNFSTSILIFATSIVLMIFGRVPFKQILKTVGLFAVLAVGVVTLGIGQRAQTVRKRIFNYTQRIGERQSNSDKNLGEDYQIHRSLFAIATGALSPKGPGKSQQKYFLSQAESDFIYAIILEEYGLLAGILLPLFFIYFMYRGASAVKFSEKPFGGLLSAGLTFAIVLQAFINMLVAVDAGPVTGQPMPMISAGGTSLIFTAISIGLILSVSRDKDKFFSSKPTPKSSE